MSFKNNYDYRNGVNDEAYGVAMNTIEKSNKYTLTEWIHRLRTWGDNVQESPFVTKTTETVNNLFRNGVQSYTQTDPTPAMNRMQNNISGFMGDVRQQYTTIQTPQPHWMDAEYADKNRKKLQSDATQSAFNDSIAQLQNPTLGMAQQPQSTYTTATSGGGATTTSAFGNNYQSPYYPLSTQSRIEQPPARNANAANPWYSMPESVQRFPYYYNEQPPKYRRDPREITRAAERAVAIVINGYGDVQAACNIGVISAFKQLHNNSTELDGMRANDLTRYWSNDTTGRWVQVRLEDTQELANRGEFVVAAWENPVPGEYGHVAVIVPGEMVSSDKWKTFVPQTMDTGIRKRESKQMLSIGFGPDKKETTKYFKYNPR